jgi:hypothetical protein
VRLYHYETGRRLVSAALFGGGGQRTGVSTVAWDIAGRCECPPTVSIVARPADNGKRYYAWRPGKPHVYRVDMEVRCRHCCECLKARATDWARRGTVELAAAWRTWLVTLSFNPPELYRAQCEAGSDERKLFKVLARRVTLYIKRLRKNSGAKGLRYWCVLERGSLHGRLHFHVLLHEPDALNGTLKRTIKDAWPHGFSDAKLVKDAMGFPVGRSCGGTTSKGMSWYMAKYLAKGLLGRVRASNHYGSPQAVDLKDGLGQGHRDLRKGEVQNGSPFSDLQASAFRKELIVPPEGFEGTPSTHLSYTSLRGRHNISTSHFEVHRSSK